MASNAQKLSAASEFIADTPPGEMNEVLAGISYCMCIKGDVRTIFDKSLDTEFMPALEKYNMEQFVTFKADDSDRLVLHV
jgi:hypothetical protein